MNSVTCQVPVYFQIDDFGCYFKMKAMLEILQHFAIAAGRLEIMLIRSAGDNNYLLESPVECDRLS